MKEIVLNGSVYYSKEVEQASKSIKPLPMTQEVIEIVIDPTNSAMDDYCESDYAAIMYEVGASANEAVAGTATGFPFSLKDFKKYCLTLLASRIGWVTNDISLLIIRPTDRTCVPAMLAQSLKAIGTVEKLDCGKFYKPVLKQRKAEDFEAWKSENLLNADQMMRMSMYLRRIENFVGASMLPKDKTGAYELCQIGILNDALVSWNSDSHPANCVLAALPGVQYSVGDYYKASVTYGDLNYMRRIVCQLTSIQC